MSNPLYENIKRDPRYAELIQQRGRFATMLALMVIGVFFSFVLLVAFVPSAIAVRIFAGSNLTVGVALGFFQFVFFCLLTWVYGLCCTSRKADEITPAPDAAMPWHPRAPCSGARVA